jgi:hypothetical protein
MGLLTRLGQRCSFFFERKYSATVSFTGLVLEIVGLVTWTKWQPVSSVLAGVGGSVLATMLVAFFGPDGDRVYQTFLRLGVTEFYPDRKKFEDWVGKLHDVRHRCILLGQALGGWADDRDFRSALLERIRDGVEVEIFFLNPTKDAAKVRATEDRKNIRGPLLSRIRASIREVWALRGQLDEESRGRLKIYVYNATPSLGLNWFDTTMYVTHYLGGLMNLTAPLLRVEYRPGPDTLYGRYEASVNEIRQNFSIQLADENFGEYTSEEADV